MPQNLTALEIMAKLVLDGWSNLVRLSPVDTGFLRSRWFVTTYAVPDISIKNPLKKGSSVPAPSQPNISTIKFGDTVTIYNNTEYASYLENGTPLYMVPLSKVCKTVQTLNPIKTDVLHTVIKMSVIPTTLGEGHENLSTYMMHG